MSWNPFSAFSRQPDPNMLREHGDFISFGMTPQGWERGHHHQQHSLPRGQHRRRSIPRSRFAEPDPELFWDTMHQQHHQIREVAPQGRSTMVEPGTRSRPKVARFGVEQGHGDAPHQRTFPFTVFGKGRENKPDPTTRRSGIFGSRGGGGRGGQHVGNNIMNKYIIKSALKKGGMAEAVNIVLERKTGHTFVQKCIPLRRSFDYKRARAEINALLKIDGHGRHENLNAIIESEISEARQKCFIILEHCDRGNVQDAIEAFRRGGGHGSEASAWSLMAGVSNGLAFLHHGLTDGRLVSRNWDPVCHLDLKPANILLSSKGGKYGHGRIVLADFGCAITASDINRQIEDPFEQNCGTPGWQPPEATANGPSTRPRYGPKTDIWQLGAMIHVFCKRLNGPDPRYLALPRPCSGLYSDWLNRTVKLLCDPQLEQRPSSHEIAREATRGFEMAVRAERGGY